MTNPCCARPSSITSTIPRPSAECDDFLLGRDLLVASVVEPGARQRQLWLPDNQDGWYDFYSHQWFAGGQWVTLDAPLEKLPLLVRAGAGLPLSERISHVDAQKRRSSRTAVVPVERYRLNPRSAV